MALTFNFNDRRILERYLEQALPQLGLEDAASRFFSGREGGLGYLLFPNQDLAKMPERIYNLYQMSLAQSYFSGVKNYLDFAEAYAKSQGFGLVAATSPDKEPPVIQLRTKDDSISVYALGIGSPAIESAEKFENFLRMAKEKRGQMDEQYKNLIDLSEKLKGRQ